MPPFVFCSLSGPSIAEKGVAGCTHGCNQTLPPQPPPPLWPLPRVLRKKKFIQLNSSLGLKEKNKNKTTNIDRGAASHHVVRIIKVQRYLGHRGCVKEGKPLKLSNCPTIGRSQPSRKTGQLFKHETCCSCCLGWLRGESEREGEGGRRPRSEKQTRATLSEAGALINRPLNG